MAEGYDGFSEESLNLPERTAPMDDPFSYLKAVIQREVVPEPFDLSSLDNNLVVMEILDAAMRSAATGKTVELD
jgi:hypothetical protein